MGFANTRELRLNTTEILKKIDKGEHVFITYRGKPRAVIHRVTEDEIEDYILLNHPEFRKKIKQAYMESLEGKVKSVDELIAETEKEIG